MDIAKVDTGFLRDRFFAPFFLANFLYLIYTTVSVILAAIKVVSKKSSLVILDFIVLMISLFLFLQMIGIQIPKFEAEAFEKLTGILIISQSLLVGIFHSDFSGFSNECEYQTIFPLFMVDCLKIFSLVRVVNAELRSFFILTLIYFFTKELMEL